MKHNQLIDAAKEVAYVPSLDRICVVTAWLGNHVIVDLGFADQRLTATVPVEGLVVFKRKGPDQTLIDWIERPESGRQPIYDHTWCSRGESRCKPQPFRLRRAVR